MKSASPLRTVLPRGVTLLELTVVLVVLMLLLAIVTIGARGWKRGVDRAGCVMTIQSVQKSMRSYQNVYGYSPGTMPYAADGTQSIARHLHAKGYISEQIHASITGEDPCPGGGDYEIPRPDVFPPVGELYIQCSLSALQSHLPPTPGQW